jgi:hypothetical protein
MLTFFLFCLAIVSQNGIRNLVAIDEMAGAEQLLVPMYGFTISAIISAITLIVVAVLDLRKLSN